jgi:hypothetical protein
MSERILNLLTNTSRLECLSFAAKRKRIQLSLHWGRMAMGMPCGGGIPIGGAPGGGRAM